MPGFARITFALEKEKQPQLKKRRILDSEDEEEPSKPAPAPAPTTAPERVKKAPAIVKQKGGKPDKKGKGKAPIVGDEEMEDVEAREEVAASEADEVAEDDADDGEDEMDEDEDLANEKYEVFDWYARRQLIWSMQCRSCVVQNS